jgi:glycosyltransferase involved in cell wall biosynthesis
MGAGIPVIASDTGGTPEQIIHNFNGYLFETGNYVDLSQKILLMIDNKNASSLGLNGKEFIDKYLNEKRMVDEIEAYYKNKLRICV